MRIVDIPEYRDKKHVLSLDENTLIIDAVKKMKKLNYGAAIVTRNDRLCGIFTERDVLMKVVAEELDVKKLKLKDVMTSDVKVSKKEDTVYDSMRRMSQGKFRHLPITDDDGHVIGMVSQGDFVAITWHQLVHQFKTQTKESLSTFTQIWLLIIPLVIYILSMIYFFTKV